jgi:hypothetical protein
VLCCLIWSYFVWSCLFLPLSRLASPCFVLCCVVLSSLAVRCGVVCCVLSSCLVVTSSFFSSLRTSRWTGCFSGLTPYPTLALPLTLTLTLTLTPMSRNFLIGCSFVYFRLVLLFICSNLCIHIHIYIGIGLSDNEQVIF